MKIRPLFMIRDYNNEYWMINSTFWTPERRIKEIYCCKFFLINDKHYYHIYEYDSKINQIKIDGLFMHCPLNNKKIIFNPVNIKIKHNFKIDKETLKLMNCLHKEPNRSFILK